MPSTVTYAGRMRVLDILLGPGSDTPLDLVLRLFRNDVVPTEFSSLDLLEEASYDGYAPITLLRDQWFTNIFTPYTPSRVYQNPYVEWEADSGSQTIYGSYMSMGLTGLFMFSRFTTPIVIQAGVTTIKLVVGLQSRLLVGV